MRPWILLILLTACADPHCDPATQAPRLHYNHELGTNELICVPR